MEEGGKHRLNKKNLAIVLGPSVVVGLGLALLRKEAGTPSYLDKSARKFLGEGTKGRTHFGGTIKGGEIPTASPSAGRTAQTEGVRPGPIKYQAAQVIRRQGADPSISLPIGTSFIGKLLTAIDTRESSHLIRVNLPYGASFDGERRIPRNSSLFGNLSYPGKGDKVYLKFSRLLFPNGQEFKVEAQALSSADYSPGLVGQYHGTGMGRIAGSVGLTMLSGISDVLVEKEMPGASAFMPTPKSSLKNGFYNGLARSTEQEAARQSEAINEASDYITVEAGNDLVISLTETFTGAQN